MSGEGFLSRWSRRKRAAEAGVPAAEPEAAPPPVAATSAPGVVAAPPAPGGVAAPPAAPPAPAPEEPPFDISTLPAIDSLTSASDFTAFLRKEVPEALKRAALRRAWSLDPAIRDFVGPADYAWDFNAPDGVPGFAPSLGGDVQQMLAQIFGPSPTPEPEPEPEPEPARIPEAPQAAPEPPVPAVPIEAAEAPLPAAEPVPVAAPRRHGSALPS